VFTVLVLSGETKIEDLPASPFQPNLVTAHLAELLQLLRTAKRDQPGGTGLR
jgi:ribonucleotide monophosphatase NagD (HAD superfamily)